MRTTFFKYKGTNFLVQFSTKTVLSGFHCSLGLKETSGKFELELRAGVLTSLTSRN